MTICLLLPRGSIIGAVGGKLFSELFNFLLCFQSWQLRKVLREYFSKTGFCAFVFFPLSLHGLINIARQRVCQESVSLLFSVSLWSIELVPLYGLVGFVPQVSWFRVVFSRLFSRLASPSRASRVKSQNWIQVTH